MASMLLVLLAVACISLVPVLGQGAGCCNKFSPPQEAFLRKLLQEEAKGLRAGMMNAFSTPRGKLCFNFQLNGSTSQPDRSVSAPKETNSGLSISELKASCPYLGKTSLNTVITTSNNNIVFPKNHHLTHEHSNLWYNMEQFDSDSDRLVFQRFDDPLYVAAGQQMRLWFGEDLKDVSEDDNGGQTCAHVFALYLWT